MLIDGNHRLEAYRKARKMTIEADVLDINAADKGKLLLYTSCYNINHGLPITPKEIERVVCRFYESKILTIEELAVSYGKTVRTIRRWTQSVRDKEVADRHNKMRELKDKGNSNREIAKVVNLTPNAVDKFFQKKEVHSSGKNFQKYAAPTIPQGYDVENDPNLIHTIGTFVEVEYRLHKYEEKFRIENSMDPVLIVLKAIKDIEATAKDSLFPLWSLFSIINAHLSNAMDMDEDTTCQAISNLFNDQEGPFMQQMHPLLNIIRDVKSRIIYSAKAATVESQEAASASA